MSKNTKESKPTLKTPKAPAVKTKPGPAKKPALKVPHPKKAVKRITDVPQAPLPKLGPSSESILRNARSNGGVAKDGINGKSLSILVRYGLMFANGDQWSATKSGAAWLDQIDAYRKALSAA